MILKVIYFHCFGQFLKSAADEPQEVKHVKNWMKNNNFTLLADFSGGEIVARYCWYLCCFTYFD